MQFNDLKAGDFARYGSRWVHISHVIVKDDPVGDGKMMVVYYTYHNGMKLAHSSSCRDYDFKKITHEVWAAHERARGNTVWGALLMPRIVLSPPDGWIDALARELQTVYCLTGEYDDLETPAAKRIREKLKEYIRKHAPHIHQR